MNLYTYQATDINGRNVKGRIKANNEQELYELLREQNLFCHEYAQLAEKRAKVKYKFKIKELAVICRQLASMLTSGISLIKALYILVSQEDNKKAKEVLREIYEEVQRGRSFSEALETQEGAFPPLFISMVSAGEVSGSLDSIMVRVADHFLRENKLNNTVKKAMVYPIILAVMMVAIIAVLFTVIMPTFIGLFPDPEAIPAMTKAVMAISDFCIDYWYVIVAAVVLLIVAYKLLTKIPKVRYGIDKLKLRMPVVGKLVSTIYLSRFSRTMANLFGAGLSMVDCLYESQAVLNNAFVREQFKGVIEDVRQGETVSDSIAKTGIFDAVFTSTLYIGEESGRIDEILNKSADFYDEESETATQRLVSMLEPVMIVIMGVVVLMMLMAIMPAIMGSYAGVAQ